MSSGFNAQVPSLVIPIGATESNALRADHAYSDAAALGITSPASLEAGTYTFEVSNDVTTINEEPTNWVTLSDGSNDIGPPAAGKGRQYTEMLPFHWLRIKKSGSNAVAEIPFTISKNFTSNF